MCLYSHAVAVAIIDNLHRLIVFSLHQPFAGVNSSSETDRPPIQLQRTELGDPKPFPLTLLRSYSRPATARCHNQSTLIITISSRCHPCMRIFFLKLETVMH